MCPVEDDHYQREELLQSSLFIEVSQGLLASAQIDLLWGFLVPRVRYGSLVCLPHPQNMNTSVGLGMSLLCSSMPVDLA